MRLGGPVFEKTADPDGWVAAVRRLGYSAAACPIGEDADDETIRAYAEAAARADVVIAEVGAFGVNPVSSDDETRSRARAFCAKRLALADAIGARCCVNCAGSRGAKWDGPDARDLTDETFDLVVESVRAIIDAAKPTRTFYTLEPMPWMFPDSPDSYARLVAAVDRERFAVHLDPVNWVSSPQRYFDNAGLIREAFAKLGDKVKSCHAKDVILREKLTTHLDEVRPGAGALDYRALLTGLAALDPDTPLMLEHLKGADEFARAAEYVRAVAKEVGVLIR